LAEIRVTGANRLAAVAARVKQTGDKDLRRELFRGIQRATKPARAEVKANATRVLPTSGGLAQVVARSRVSTKTRMRGQQVGVRITGQSDMDIASINRGRLRHPLFGDRGHWYSQQVRPGFFTEPLERMAPQVRAELLAVIDRIESALGGS